MDSKNFHTGILIHRFPFFSKKMRTAASPSRETSAAFFYIPEGYEKETAVFLWMAVSFCAEKSVQVEFFYASAAARAAISFSCTSDGACSYLANVYS